MLANDAAAASLLPVAPEEDESKNRDFLGDESEIRETKFGKLVTVSIEYVPDSDVVYLTLLVPAR